MLIIYFKQVHTMFKLPQWNKILINKTAHGGK
jgi:hypothetical protein